MPRDMKEGSSLEGSGGVKPLGRNDEADWGEEVLSDLDGSDRSSLETSVDGTNLEGSGSENSGSTSNIAMEFS